MTASAPPEVEVLPSAPADKGGVVVVRRNDDRPRAGQGMWRGMRRVIAHFAKTLTSRVESKADTMGMFTVQYPEERLPLPEASRNFPILLYDDETGQELCTSCFQCERVCPPQVIHMTQAKDPQTGKPVPAVVTFVIEYDACMSCGFCAEVCPFDAIKMDHAYELATPDHLSLDVDKEGLDRPISYYEGLVPILWAEVREAALKKLANNVKRRVGTIGIAPQMLDQVFVQPVVLTEAEPVAAVVEPPTEVEADKPTVSDKQARLEAIRAAKRAAAAGAVAPEPSIITEVEKPVLSEKQARLEAIRAAKRAAAAAEAGSATAEPEAATAMDQASQEPSTAPDGQEHVSPSATTTPQPSTGNNMSAEKLARLEAIRAAKRARESE